MNELKVELADVQMFLEGIAAQIEQLNRQAQPFMQRKQELMKLILEEQRATTKKVADEMIEKAEAKPVVKEDK